LLIKKNAYKTICQSYIDFSELDKDLNKAEEFRIEASKLGNEIWENSFGKLIKQFFRNQN